MELYIEVNRKDEIMSKIDYVDDVRVYHDAIGTLAYYDDWASANGYKKREDMRARMHEQGFSEEDIDEEDDRMQDLFVDWCDAHEIIASE